MQLHFIIFLRAEFGLLDSNANFSVFLNQLFMYGIYEVPSTTTDPSFNILCSSSLPSYFLEGGCNIFLVCIVLLTALPRGSFERADILL